MHAKTELEETGILSEETETKSGQTGRESGQLRISLEETETGSGLQKNVTVTR